MCNGRHTLDNRTYVACGTCSRPSLTVQHWLVQAPVDAQAVLLLLHASFTLAAVQRGGQQRRHGVLTLVSRPGPQLHAAVPRHTLPEGAQSRAAGVVAGAGVSGAQAVPPAHGQSHTWDSWKRTEDRGQRTGWVDLWITASTRDHENIKKLALSNFRELNPQINKQQWKSQVK